MAGGGPQGDKPEQEEMKWLAAAIAVVIVCAVIWIYARNVVVWAMFALDLAQIAIPRAIWGLNPVGEQIWTFAVATFDGRVDPFSVKWDEIEAVSRMAGHLGRWPIAAMIAVMTVVAMMKMKGGGLKTQFSLSGPKDPKDKKDTTPPGLAQFQAKHWRVITPGVLFNPDGDNSQEPAMTPPEWLKANGVTLSDGKLDTDAAKKAFESQLGDIWGGVEKAKLHVQTIAVLCAINAMRDDTAGKIVKGAKVRKCKEDLSVMWATKKTKEDEAKIVEYLAPWLANEKVVKAINKHCGKHAYTNTALYRLLVWARQTGGVFASAEFLWLRGVDRQLWFVLNNAGRRAFHVEGAGAVSHFQTEQVLGQPLAETRIDLAMDGLEEYLATQSITDLDKFFLIEKDF